MPAKRAETEQHQKKKKKIIEPILFLSYEEYMLSSNLNSKLRRFHCAHPNVSASVSSQMLIILIYARVNALTGIYVQVK